jgi:hypothetical protein
MTHQDHSLTTALHHLHEQYVEAVNTAVAEDRMDLVDSLAADFDRETLTLLSERGLRAA